jgi:hypothetical protein
MITEDYVSYKTAKLLKEKGFDEKCIAVYHDGELQLVSSLGIFSSKGYGEQILTYTNSECEWSPIMISAPTIQMTMKWLREVHNVFIDISSRFSKNADKDVCFSYSCKKLINTYRSSYEIIEDGEWLNYEEACEAAIKYCLENLI